MIDRDKTPAENQWGSRKGDGMKPMRIAFSGSSGTGKTTLMNFVADRYGLEACPVGSRSVAQSMGYANPYDVDAAGRRTEFQERLIRDKIAWEASHDSFVSDRTVVDNLTYHTLHNPLTVTEGLIDETKLAFRRYTRVIFCEMAGFWDTANDPSRIKSRGYHFMWQRLCEGLLIDFQAATLSTEEGCSVRRLSASGLDSRKSCVVDFLEK